MKACLSHTCAALALTFVIAGCIPRTASPAPAPAAPPAQAVTVEPEPPTRPPPAAPEPAQTVMDETRYDNYLDAPQTAGTWFYIEEPDETLAVFGPTRQAPLLIMRCVPGSGTIGIARVQETDDQSAPSMRIVTETATRTLDIMPIASRQPLAIAELPARDPLLDAMAITKGRFALELAGMPALYVPAWAEVTRVIEDCR